MKIAFIADLHIDRHKNYQSQDFINSLNYICSEKEIDILIINGDVSNNSQVSLNFLENLDKACSSQVYLVPGNHDYWQGQPTKKATLLIHEYFQSHQLCLVNQVIRLKENYLLLASPGWYNHHYYNRQKFNPGQINKGSYKLSTWQDRRFIDWGTSDADISKSFAKHSYQALNNNYLPDDQVILASHIVTVPDYIVPMPHPAFDYFNAYIATNDFDPIYRDFKVTHSVMGHVHFRHQKNKNKRKLIVNSLGYVKEWWQKDLTTELLKALYIISI